MGVRIENLTKVYDGKAVAVDAVSLQLEAGLLGLLGPNGAGKTTLMRILATLLDPSSGTASIDGYDVRRHREEVRRILGYLPQQFGLYPQFSCRDFLDYIGLMYGMARQERRDAAERVLDQVNLTEAANRKIRALSGGMKQRLGIAQAILASPRLLIVDEPTSGLDPEERIRVRNLLADLARDRVVILSTHIVGDVATTASSLALLRKGKVIFHGPPSALLAEIHGKAWKALIEETALPELRQHWLITSVQPTPDGLEARLLAEDPAGAPGIRSLSPAEPGLEDAYIWMMGSAEAAGASA